MRTSFLDIARGIGICLVVLGHNWMAIYGSAELFRVLYSFHVPLFFFLSGTLFNPNREFASVVLGKLESIVKPYACVLSLLGIVEVALKGAKLSVYFLGVVIATGHSIKVTALWFLPHLFLVFVFSWCVCKVFPFTRMPLMIRIAVPTILLVFGVNSIGLFWKREAPSYGEVVPSWQAMLSQNGLPWSADILLITSAFFLFGHFLSAKVSEFVPTWKSLALSTWVFALMHVISDTTIDLNVRRYDDFFVSTLQAVLGIYIVISWSKLIPVVSVVGRSLAYIGSGSLFVLLFHTFIQGKLFSILNLNGMGGEYVSAAIALCGSVAGSLLLWEAIKKYQVLRIMFVPKKLDPSAVTSTPKTMVL